MNSLTPLGVSNWRTNNQSFGIKDQDRLNHIYAIGKSGTGKTTLLANMIISDIQRGNGCALIDPHNDVSEMILNYVPQHRIQDVIYFNPKDLDFPIAFNPLKGIHPNHHHLVVSGLISTYKRLWADSWGPRLEYILRFCLLTLLYVPDATLLDIQRLLTDYNFRNKLLPYVKNLQVETFWRTEFDKYPPALKAEAITPILNKMGVFISSTPLRNILGQNERSFDIQQVMDEGKILICNLSKGELGEDVSSILGSVLVTSIQLAALYRSSQAEDYRRPFYLYVDEMQSFISLSFADMLAEARKFKLSLFLTHQYIEQLPEQIRSAVFGNVGTIMSFSVGAEDALFLEKEFEPVFTQNDFVTLPKYHLYIKLMIDGTTSKPFSATTVPLKSFTESYKNRIVYNSRQQYGRERGVIEQSIFARTQHQKNNENPSLFSSFQE